MTRPDVLTFRSPLGDYLQRAEALLDAVETRDPDAEWRFKWMHPQFHGLPVSEVCVTPLDLEDAKLVVALEHSFASWLELSAFTHAIERQGPVLAFERAADAVVSGDVDALRALLRERPALVTDRSSRRHHATLLHYVAANGVEEVRQRTPANAVAVATLLLESGADANALADMYMQRCTTLSMLVSSAHPAEAGLQLPLATTLVEHGAALDGVGTAWQSAVMTALSFGFLETARGLAARQGPVEDLAIAAGLGLHADSARLVSTADRERRSIALSLAAQHGHVEVVRLLLDARADADAYNPEGFHAHSTPLHQAVLGGHTDVVRALVEHGVRLDVKDRIHDGTPLDWALRGDQVAIAEYLRGRMGRR